jgi:hypothetical protein
MDKVRQLEDLISRQSNALALQTDKIGELQREVEILRGGLQQAGIDAVLFLKSVYGDPDAPLRDRIQAAAVVAKIQAAPKVVNQGNFVLFDYLEAKRLERIAQRHEAAKTIDAKRLDN